MKISIYYRWRQASCGGGGWKRMSSWGTSLWLSSTLVSLSLQVISWKTSTWLSSILFNCSLQVSSYSWWTSRWLSTTLISWSFQILNPKSNSLKLEFWLWITHISQSWLISGNFWTPSSVALTNKTRPISINQRGKGQNTHSRLDRTVSLKMLLLNIL